MTYDRFGNLDTVDGPLSGTADTTKYRYDAARQLVGEIAPDPDGTGALKHRAVRVTWRSDGQVSKRELGTVNSQSDSDWSAFSPLETVDITFDSNNRPGTRKLSGGGAAYALTQISYDSLGRPDCSAVRMNTAVYGSLPSSACSLGTEGSFGKDRISQTVYDAAGQVTQQKVAVGTTDEAVERTLTYTSNGRLQTLKDGENNLTTYEYDGHDRLAKTRFPVATKGANSSSTTDYEQLSYDANGNVTSRRLRDGNSIGFTIDNVNRPTFKDLPGSEPDVTYGYDNLGRLTSASQTGHSLSFTWDALGRNLTQVSPLGTVTSEWDVAGRRTKLTYPGSGLYVNYDHLVTGEVSKIRENGATSGVGVLATYGYDDLRRRISLTFGNGVAQSFTFDAVSRLASLSNDLSGTTNDLSATFAYNSASQIGSTIRTGDTYAWTSHFNQNRSATSNGLNQLTAYGDKSLSHDARGNVTAYGSRSFTYSSENLLLTAPGSAALTYDPAMRLYQLEPGTRARLAYDGLDRIAEYDGANALQRRYVHGSADDEPLVWYEGSGTTDRRFLSADERGSIIAVTDSTGALLAINRYDEYGQPQSTNVGAFGYTGQAWLQGTGLWHYKARAYDPELGRFLQTDPIGVRGGINLYGYVGGDPVNRIDPLGLEGCDFSDLEGDEIPVCGSSLPAPQPQPQLGGFSSSFGGGAGPVGDPCSGSTQWDFIRCLSTPLPVAFDLGSLANVEIEVVGRRWRDVRDLIKSVPRRARQAICSFPTVNVGGGADFYAIAGGSLGGGLNFDFANGRFGVSAYTAIGLGLGVDAGPNIGGGPSGGGMVSVNLAAGAGFALPTPVPGLNLGASGTYNLIGTDPGFAGGGIGRAGSPLGYGNVGANIGFSSGSLYGCS